MTNSNVMDFLEVLPFDKVFPRIEHGDRRHLFLRLIVIFPILWINFIRFFDAVFAKLRFCYHNPHIISFHRFCVSFSCAIWFELLLPLWRLSRAFALLRELSSRWQGCYYSPVCAAKQRCYISRNFSVVVKWLSTPILQDIELIHADCWENDVWENFKSYSL